MITFATFHVENQQTADKQEIKSNVINKDFYHLIIQLLFKSASLFHPDCRTAVLTDERTDFSYLQSSINTFRVPIKIEQAPLMYSRLAAQIEYIKKHGSDSNVVFLDADILINANLDHVFDQEFDIALTYRDDDDMPINWGVMFISNRQPEKAVCFLGKVLENYRTTYFTSPIFWCDQYALMDTIGRLNFFERSSDIIVVDGVKILLVPCSSYNFSPPAKISAISSKLVGKYILHFKGPRKQFIPLYWNAYLAWRTNFGISQLIQSGFDYLSILQRSLYELASANETPLFALMRKGKRALTKLRSA